MALERILLKVGEPMVRTIRRLMGEAYGDFEDVYQEACVNLVSAIARFEGRSSFQSFACSIAVNTALNARRTRAHRERSLRLDQDPDEMLHDNGRQSSLDAMVRREELLGLLDALPDDQAEALVLQVVLGHTIEEIAGLTNAPRETVRSRLRLAKGALARQNANTMAPMRIGDGSA
jgi:RNA polymerase sigma-70 factor (ECF subfamily)